jgi:hypothetical protein
MKAKLTTQSSVAIDINSITEEDLKEMIKLCENLTELRKEGYRLNYQATMGYKPESGYIILHSSGA